MKLHYYPETDSLYIELSATSSAETRAVTDQVNLDFSAEGTLVGIDMDEASKRLDLASLETSDLPLRALKAA